MNIFSQKFKLYAGSDGFWSLFVSFALAYFVFFFGLPYVLIITDGSPAHYGEILVNFSTEQIVITGVCGFFFLISFLISSILISRIECSGIVNPFRNIKGRLVLSIAIYILTYLTYFYFFVDPSYNYDVRQGSEDPNHLKFFIVILFGALGSFLVILANELGFRFLAGLLLIVILLVTLLSGSGRLSALFSILLLFNLITGLGTKGKHVFVGCIFLFSLLPIVLNLKSVIYAIAVKGDIDISNVYSFFQVSGIKESFLGNFAHPVISMLVIDRTLEQIGFRFFYDYIQGVLFFLRIIGVDLGNSLTYFNTYSILGYMRSIIPPGYIAFGYLQMNIIGVVFSGVFFAFIGYSANFVRVKLAPNSNLAKLYFAFVAANTFYHGEVRIIIMTLFLPFFLLLLFNRVITIKKIKLF